MPGSSTVVMSFCSVCRSPVVRWLAVLSDRGRQRVELRDPCRQVRLDELLRRAEGRRGASRARRLGGGGASTRCVAVGRRRGEGRRPGPSRRARRPHRPPRRRPPCDVRRLCFISRISLRVVQVRVRRVEVVVQCPEVGGDLIECLWAERVGGRGRRRSATGAAWNRARARHGAGHRVVVDVDDTDVVGVIRATTCDELPAPQAANVTATPLSSVAVTSLGVFISIPPRAPRSDRRSPFHRTPSRTSEAALPCRA